jgi:hypothetical protein
VLWLVAAALLLAIFGVLSGPPRGSGEKGTVFAISLVLRRLGFGVSWVVLVAMCAIVVLAWPLALFLG